VSTATTGKGVLARAREIVHWEGALGLLRRGLRRALHPVLWVHRLLFFEMDLTQPIPKLEARVPLETRVASEEDLDAFEEALREFEVDAAGARQRLASGDLLTLAISRGTLVNVGWITFSSPYIDEIDAIPDLRPGESCGYQAMTHPSWRGLGIQPVAALFRNECQRARGCTRHISWVVADNAANVHTQSVRGRRRTKAVWAFWVLGMRRPFLVGATREGSPSLIRPKEFPRPSA